MPYLSIVPAASPPATLTKYLLWERLRHPQTSTLRDGASPTVKLSAPADLGRRLRRQLIDLPGLPGWPNDVFDQHIYLADRILPEADHIVVQPPIAAARDLQLAQIPET